jgi:hypothetical protein
MGTTSLVLRLQSDQILDGPTIGTTLNLKNLTATNRLQLVWAQPAVDPAPLLFKDPGSLPAPVGTVSVIASNNAVLGSGTTFLTTFSIGQAVSFGNQPDIVYIIATIPDNTHLTLTTNFGGLTNASTTITSAGADAVVYENLQQTITNKILGAGVIISDQPQYAHLAGQAGGQTLNGGTNASNNLVLRSTTNVTKGEVLIDEDNLTMGSGLNIIFSGSGQPVGLPATPSGATAAASKLYVDNQIASISGGSGVWREVLLSQVQLDTPHKAIAQATAFFFAAAPATVGNTFVITDGTNTETYTFSAVSGFRQPIPGVSAAASQTNLVARINSDSGFWLAQEFSDLQSINSGGNTVVLWRRVPTFPGTDRIYGTITGATVSYVNYNAQLDYRSSTLISLPTVDPAVETFGISRITSGLIPDEAHLVRAEDAAWLWNSDAGTWQLTAGAVVLGTSAPAAGGTVGQVSGDESSGIHIIPSPNPGMGAVQVKVDGTSIDFNGSGQLAIAGGAVPLGTSAPAAGGIPGKVSGDESSGIHITGTGALQAKTDGVSIVFDGSGNLRSTPVAQVPTGTVSLGALLTQNITGTNPPAAVFVATDIPAEQYSHSQVQGQLMDFVVPDDYDSGALSISAVLQMVTPGSPGNVRIQTQAKIVKNETGTIDTTTFPATPSTITPTAASSFFQRIVLLSITNGTFSRGDTIQFYFTRLGTNVLDTDTRAAQIVSFEVAYTGQVSTRAATQTADVFGSVFGVPTPPAGNVSSDIPTLDFSGSVDQAAACYFIVPDNWDGISSAYVRAEYALAAPGTAGNIGLQVSGNIADAVGGGVIPITPATFTFPVSGTNPFRSPLFGQIPATSMTKGSFIELAIRRITSTPGNTSSTFQLINVTITFGVFPVVGFQTSTQGLLGQGVFGNFSGTVTANIDYPNIGLGEYQALADMSSTTASGRVDVAFQGVLQSGQTQVSQLYVPIKGSGPTPQYHILVYAEGTVGTVYDSGLQTPAGSLTLINVPGASLSAQPTGGGHYLVVVQAFINSGDTLFAGRPTFQQQ